MAARLTKTDWLEIAKDLRGAAQGWWKDNQHNVISLGKEEMRQIAASLKEGDLVGAKFELVSRMTPKEWQAYRDGTTAQLRAIAKQRAALLDSLGSLSRRLAKALAKAILKRL